MRIITLILLMLYVVAAQAGELEKAYQKEFAYLVSEKKALEQQLKNLKSSHTRNRKKLAAEIDSLQKKFLGRQNKTDQLNRQIVEATRDVDFAENDSLLLATTLSQADETLKKLGIEVDASQDPEARLGNDFHMASKTISNDGKVVTGKSRYFLPDGEAIVGDVINIGRIAKYGVSDQGSGALAPAGNGMFKIWDGQSRDTAVQLADKLHPASLDIFLFDNVEKGIEKEDERSVYENIEASGIVGKIIIALGFIGAVLVVVRIAFLMRAGSNMKKVSDNVNCEVENGNIDKALKICKKNSSAASKVIAATLRNLKKDRDHIEDIISETILNESTYIDRFSSAIMVIAAIAPLLGLLGTVTGMISTFDVITEYGTGDPKLLSSGISVALLTTEFGLIVAIPMLLAGNLLSSWGRRIKSDLEQAALHMINCHKSA